MKNLNFQVSKKKNPTEKNIKKPKKPDQKNYIFKCQICFKTFPNRWNLNRHVKSHTGEKPFKCDHPKCGKSFSRKDNLKGHQVTHSDKRPFKCQLCGSDYKHKKSLRKHMNLEHNEMKK